MCIHCTLPLEKKKKNQCERYIQLHGLPLELTLEKLNLVSKALK